MTANATQVENKQPRTPWTVEAALKAAAARTKMNARAPDSAAHFLLDRVEQGAADQAEVDKIAYAFNSAESIGVAVRNRPGFSKLKVSN